ncbi:hypothetical protein [Candidatus Methylobacter oryzae]|uniref:N-acetyltransferase n=1 Tax=Candidatus Methylobacter oryzae TaxID=2497749 RepID=A0ABY3CC77_9GAMM|nr:hypothetical protein [Candidatus Methylobacter oryzae]TRW96999.1 hypothetical protein EKO24_008240 [Candidatus Methylobacter oryzae]
MSNVHSAIDAVFEQVADFFSSNLQKEIKITSINSEALNAWQQSWSSSLRIPPNGGWDWRCKLSNASRKYQKRLMSVAVWGQDNCLCGLALCSRSKSNEVLSVHYIEGAPIEQHPLTGYVFNIINAVLHEYSYVVNANKIRIMYPVKDLIDFYNSHGYILSKKSLFGRPYCEKGIER